MPPQAIPGSSADPAAANRAATPSAPDLELMLAAMPAVCSVLSPDLRYVAVTDEFLRVTGSTRAEVIGRHVLDVFPPDPDSPQSAVEVLDSFERARRSLATQAPVRVRYDLLQSPAEGDGYRGRYWNSVLVPVLGPDQRLAYIISWPQDSTDRAGVRGQSADTLLRANRPLQKAAAERDMTAHQAAEFASRRLATAMTSSEVAIFIQTTGGVIQTWNLGAEQLYGYSEAEVLGKSLLLLVPPGREGEVADIIQDVVTRRGEVTRETIRLRKDGRPVRVALSLSPIFDDQGAVDEIVTVAQDITKRVQAEAALAKKTRELETSNRELEQFAAVASHDLREPLRKVASFCQLLASDYHDQLDEEAQQYIAYAVDGAVRMQQLIDDLLTLAQVGRQSDEAARVDCNQVVQRVAQDLATAFDESGGTMVVTGELPVVTADPTLIVQLFENLVANALKFRSAERPRVEISATRDGPWWRFSVADNGIGFDPQYADRIFTLFQRLHSRSEYPGTGIGLAICQKIVERYGGRIWVDSVPGAGSTFYWTMPSGTRES